MSKKIEQFKVGVAGNYEFPFMDKDEWLYSAIQLTFYNGSTFSGTVILQASLDKTNWEDITGTSQAISGTSGSHLWDYPETAIPYLRVKISGVSGSADLEVDASFSGWGGRY